MPDERIYETNQEGSFKVKLSSSDPNYTESDFSNSVQLSLPRHKVLDLIAGGILDLPSGSHSIQVRAFDHTHTYGPSQKSAAIYFTL